MQYKQHKQDILSILKINYNNFTSVEKSIADFFLTNQHSMDFSSKNIAGKLYTSEASLSRFAQKCGFQGYRQFIYVYQEEFSQINQRKLEDNTELILNTYQELLNESHVLINEEQIKRVAKLISEKKKIYIHGKGFSGVAAEEFMLRLVCVGIQAQCITDSHLMAMNFALIDSDSLVIGITVSGKANEILYTLKKAKIQGASTVVISSTHIKKWDAFCDEILLIPTKEKLTLGKQISPQFPILVLLDILYSNILQYDQHVQSGFPEFLYAELMDEIPDY